MTLRGKIIFITGASRGIGKAIALRCARDGAYIAIAAKTSDVNPKLPGTIYTAAAEIEEAGGRALPIVCDIRSEEQVIHAISETVKKWGGIDVVINNASAIKYQFIQLISEKVGTELTSSKKYDLMNQVNARGTWLVSKHALPHLKKSSNAHILNICPPLSFEERWFSQHVAYSIAKYGMSMCVLGMAGEFRPLNIAVNALWPKTMIQTAAMSMIPGASDTSKMRKPTIMADAAYVILNQLSSEYSGNFTVDEDVITSQCIQDLDVYANKSGTKDFIPDFFIPDDYTFMLPPRKVLHCAASSKL